MTSLNAWHVFPPRIPGRIITRPGVDGRCGETTWRSRGPRTIADMVTVRPGVDEDGNPVVLVERIDAGCTALVQDDPAHMPRLVGGAE